MRVALLCPGPSLPRTYPGRSGYRTVIAVNRAALSGFPFDWLAALDMPLLCDLATVATAANLLTSRNTRNSLARRGLWQTPGVLLTEDMACPVPGWDQYTATCGLVLAGRLGARRVDVYGADWTDAPDFDGGTPPGCVRTAARWEREAEVWGGVVGWLGENGTTVRRVKP